MIQFFVWGSINIDEVYSLPHVPQKGETLHALTFQQYHGGKGANQALAISRLGGKSFLIGDIGEDDEGRKITIDLAQQGVNTDGITAHQGYHTGRASIYLYDQTNHIVIASQANQLFSPSIFTDIMNKYANPNDIFILQFEKSHQHTHHAIKEAKSRGLYVICNPSPMNISLLKEIQPFVDCLVINEIEYEQMTNQPYQGKNETIFPNVIVTLGKEGSHAHMNHSVYIQEPIMTEVKDTTGAGDTFLAGFAVWFGKTSDVKASLEFAAKAAAIKISRYGAQSGIPYLNEIVKL